MVFTVPKDGDILSEAEMTELFAWRARALKDGAQLAPEIERLVPKIGDRTSDGTIYGGISPETNRRMFTTVEETPTFRSAKDAKSYASALCDAKGRGGFQLPAVGELSVLWNNGLIKSEKPAARSVDGGLSTIAARVRCIRYGQLELQP